MVRERLLDVEQDPFAARIGAVRVARPSGPILGDDRVALEIGVVDVEARFAGRAVAGVEREAEQAPFPARTYAIPDVEEWLTRELSVLDDPDPARLLEHEESPASIAG